ncbi:MAG: type II toxin-antitoxin system HicA family toxin [Deltaproteobacteria bacterium]|nr:type II toxin-antitoxin system HicA family toxin [Deltaproteobacteria bacterium]
MKSLFEKKGYSLVKGGKGSHFKLKKVGKPTMIIPNHKELGKGLEQALLKALEGIKEI